jgi:hypothetical protein
MMMLTSVFLVADPVPLLLLSAVVKFVDLVDEKS